MKLLLPRLAAVFALAAPAALGHGDRFFPRPPLPLPIPVPCGPSFRIGTPRFSIEFGGDYRPRHEHCFTYHVEREWVAPVWRSQLVGYDCHRRPIVRRVLVREGYWTTVRYRTCACGERIRC